MKKYAQVQFMEKLTQDGLRIALMLLIFFTAHFAQAKILEDANKSYTIQLGTFAGAKQDDFLALKKWGYVYAENMSDEIRRIFLSNFSTQEEAELVLASVKEMGYADAFVSERDLNKGKINYTIQLALHKSTDNIPWSKYASTGALSAIFEKSNVRITSGAFANTDLAIAALEKIKAAGFEGAFVKKTNSLLLHNINDFDVPNLTMPTKTETVLTSKGAEPVLKPKGAEPTTQPAVKVDLSPKKPSKVNPSKRQSVLELQKFLKSQAAYSAATDGKYGAGTAKGIALYSDSNEQYNRYKANSEKLTEKGEQEADFSSLEGAIIGIGTEKSKAQKTLETRKEPLAKAYLAYIYFNSEATADKQKVNDLMNAAIEEGFAGFKGNAGFDYKATYDYKTLGQLISHISHLQKHSKDQVAVPCWLFQQHTAQASAAFQDKSFKMQNCGGFTEWENIRILESIASDLQISDKKNEEKDAQLASQRQWLMLSPQAPSVKEKDQTMLWHNTLWLAMDDFGKQHPFHAKFVAPLKLAYHQSWIDLEDYYLSKGLAQPDANALALSVLKTIVEPYLADYMR